MLQVYGISGLRYSTLFGRWRQRRGRSLAVRQQLAGTATSASVTLRRCGPSLPVPRQLFVIVTDAGMSDAEQSQHGTAPTDSRADAAASTTVRPTRRPSSPAARLSSHTCPWVSFVWPDPTQPISWLTQLQVEKIGPNPTQRNTTNNGAYSLVETYFYTYNLSCTFSQLSINLFMFVADQYT